MSEPASRVELGRYVPVSTVGERVKAYVPPLLPPDPPVNLDLQLTTLLTEASAALGRLDGMSRVLPDTKLFVYLYVRKEAVLTSQIEGTQSSLADLLLYESHLGPGTSPDDVVESSNYVAAVEEAVRLMRGEGVPLSGRVLRAAHRVLLRSGRGAVKDPGEYRRSQNWVGGSRPGNATYVPPPPELVPELMGRLEGYIHGSRGREPALLIAGQAHVQFESIHPFLDGNGRLGRLLVVLVLLDSGVISEPNLYLSLYLKAHRERYYDLLQAVRTKGAWEEWMDFFLSGVAETADEAVARAHRLLELIDRDRLRIRALPSRRTGTALRVHERLQSRPFLVIPAAAADLGVTQPTVASALDSLADLGIVREITGKQRHRIWAYGEYLNLLSDDLPAEGRAEARPRS